MRTLQPAGWPRPSGYANGVAATGELVFVAGQVGWDPKTERFERTDLAGQVEQALRNVVAVLAEAGARPEHVTRMTWYVTSREEHAAARAAIGPAYRSVMGAIYPAMTLLYVAGLADERAKVEIEVTAVIAPAD
jgi:enamine deaminase RidA (YjgF/YER057c/UK114 family)